jgi:hypothetical protein
MIIYEISKKSKSVDDTKVKMDLCFCEMELSESTARKSDKMKGVASI